MCKYISTSSSRSSALLHQLPSVNCSDCLKEFVCTSNLYRVNDNELLERCHGGQVAGGLTELKLHISHGETI